MNRNTTNFENETHVKIFQIQNTSDEEALNAFLAGKAVRHWSINFTPSASLPAADGSPLILGVWNVFVVYHDREAESHGHDQQIRQERFVPLQKKNSGQSSGPSPAVLEKRAEARKPVESYKPEVADQDFPLFESLRTWRNSRAREERVKPFTFFNNRQLEQIVSVKPADAPALKDIASDMDSRLWDKYHKELLGFIDAARSTNGAAPHIPVAEPEPLEAA